MDREWVRVESGTRLQVAFWFHAADRPTSDRVVVLHHGILHTRETFLPLIEALNAQGLHAVMIEQQSEKAGLFRNFIGLSSYVQGMRRAVEAIEQYLAQRPEPLRIGLFACHSMGAEIAEETLQAHPALRRPLVLMAPIPVRGAFPVFCRILVRHPFALLKAVFTLSVLSLARSPDRVRELFFDAHTPEEIVQRTTRQLRHSPFWAYVQLTFRRWLRPRIVADGLPKRLLISETDFIFRPGEYDLTRRLYRGTLTETQLPGGHDFLIEYAEQTAAEIGAFCETDLKTRLPAS